MNKDQFQTLLINATALTEREAQALDDLSQEFPYSQVIHNLSARASADCNLTSKAKLLHTSAIYSTDRGALKAIMTAPKKARVEPQLVVEVAKPIEVIVAPTAVVESGGLAEQVLADIASLQESKRLFELTIERLEKEKALPLPTKKGAPEKIEEELKENDSLIEEIKSTKKKIKPEGVKQKEQIEIIDQFIKTQPSISRPKPSDKAIDGDLSEPGAQFGENIVSETLVEILMKQGKKEKAIEALKKLIWKFPQKKAYFAAQIEELRK